VIFEDPATSYTCWQLATLNMWNNLAREIAMLKKQVKQTAMQDSAI